MIRIFLIDESITIRRALEMYLSLEPDLLVVGAVKGGLEAIAALQQAEPDVIIVSVDRLERRMLATIESIHSAKPNSPLVLLMLYDNLRLRSQAEAAGASAFVSKHDSIEVLLQTVRRLQSASGEIDTV